MNRRDLEMMAAMARAMQVDERPKRRGCHIPFWVIFLLLGLPFDICLILGLLGVFKK